MIATCPTFLINGLFKGEIRYNFLHIRSTIKRLPVNTHIMADEIERVINYRREHKDVGYRKLAA